MHQTWYRLYSRLLWLFCLPLRSNDLKNVNSSAFLDIFKAKTGNLIHHQICLPKIRLFIVPYSPIRSSRLCAYCNLRQELLLKAILVHSLQLAPYLPYSFILFPKVTLYEHLKSTWPVGLLQDSKMYLEFRILTFSSLLRHGSFQ